MSAPQSRMASQSTAAPKPTTAKEPITLDTIRTKFKDLPTGFPTIDTLLTSFGPDVPVDALDAFLTEITRPITPPARTKFVETPEQIPGVTDYPYPSFVGPGMSESERPDHTKVNDGWAPMSFAEDKDYSLKSVFDDPREKLWEFKNDLEACLLYDTIFEDLEVFREWWSRAEMVYEDALGMIGAADEIPDLKERLDVVKKCKDILWIVDFSKPNAIWKIANDLFRPLLVDFGITAEEFVDILVEIEYDKIEATGDKEALAEFVKKFIGEEEEELEEGEIREDLTPEQAEAKLREFYRNFDAEKVIADFEKGLNNQDPAENTETLKKAAKMASKLREQKLELIKEYVLDGTAALEKGEEDEEEEEILEEDYEMIMHRIRSGELNHKNISIAQAKILEKRQEGKNREEDDLVVRSYISVCFATLAAFVGRGKKWWDAYEQIDECIKFLETNLKNGNGKA